MSQSSITIWAMLALFFVFITVRGELPAYMGVFIGSKSGGGSASSGTAGEQPATAQSGILGNIGQVGNLANAADALTNATWGLGNQDFSGGSA